MKINSRPRGEILVSRIIHTLNTPHSHTFPEEERYIPSKYRNIKAPSTRIRFHRKRSRFQ